MTIYVEHVWAFAEDEETIYCTSCLRAPADVFPKSSCEPAWPASWLWRNEPTGGHALTFVGWSANGRPLFRKDWGGEVYEA
jgi:hypothetical protein